MTYLLIYLVICLLFCVYAIRAFRYSFCNINPWSYVRIILFSPILTITSLFNCLYIKWFWSERKPKDKSLKTASKFISSKFQEILEFDFLFNRHRNSLSMALYRYTLFTFDSCVVGSFMYNVYNLKRNLALLIPWNRWANFVGQQFMYSSENTKLLTNSSCRTRDADIKYYTYKVHLGCLTITETRYVDDKNVGHNTFLNAFIDGEDLKPISTVFFKGYIFTKKQAHKVLKEWSTLSGLFHSYSFVKNSFGVERLMTLVNLLADDMVYDVRPLDSDIEQYKANKKAYILAELYFYLRDKFDKEVDFNINKIFASILDLKLTPKYKQSIILALKPIIEEKMKQVKDFNIYYN